MRPVILLRDRGVTEDERKAMAEFFPVTPSRLDIQPDDLVIGRYSVLPYYSELEKDVRTKGGRLINTARQHDWIADLSNWAGEGGALQGLTPAAWTTNEFAHRNNPGPFVLKGQTNSKKQLWNTHMYAATRQDVGPVVSNLLADTFIGDQEIYIRPYVKLFEMMKGENGLPITREFRFFMLRGEVLQGGFYWSAFVDEIREGRFKNLLDHRHVPPAFLQKVAERLAPHAPFTAVDVAVTADKQDWLVTDVNDGQMAGLSEVDPYHLYKTLKEKLTAGMPAIA